MVKLRIALTRCALLLLALCVARADKALAQFDPPRIAQVLHKRNEAGPAAEQIAPNYYIDKGQEANIFAGNELNVYRERFVVPDSAYPCEYLSALSKSSWLSKALPSGLSSRTRRRSRGRLSSTSLR